MFRVKYRYKLGSIFSIQARVVTFNSAFQQKSADFNNPVWRWNSFISFIQAISIAPLQVHYYSEVLTTQHGYCIRISRRSATGNCGWRTYPRSLCL